MNMSIEAVKKKFSVKNGTLEIRDKNNNEKNLVLLEPGIRL